MRIGVWIHDADNEPLERLIEEAARAGLASIRSYSIEYAKKAAAAIRSNRLSLLAGMHVDAGRLAADWRSEVRLGELATYLELDLPMEAVCVGNELREGGDEPQKKRFTSVLSLGLARLLEEYRSWMARGGVSIPLTYAMEGIVLDREGGFREHVWPLVDACDIVCLNAYPMDDRGWFGWGAFEESRRFLEEPGVRVDRLAVFERRLRRALGQLADRKKGVFLSETGFPSAIGFCVEAGRVSVRTEGPLYGSAMEGFIGLLKSLGSTAGCPIEAAYIYEWRDNPFHAKIWNEEQSPIHAAFGLCDLRGRPKFDLGRIL